MIISVDKELIMDDTIDEISQNILLDQDGKKEVTPEISVQSSSDNENYCYEGMKNLIRISIQ